MFDFIECRARPKIEVSKKIYRTRSIRLYNEDLRDFGLHWTKDIEIDIEIEVDAVKDQVCGLWQAVA